MTSKMAISSITKGRIETPLRLVLYGPEGCGKSTFAAAAPDPVFIAAESGTNQLDVARFPMPQTWGDVLDAVRVLGIEAHRWQTVVLDTLDAIEPMIWTYVIERAASDKIKSIEDFGYGKGYTAALEEWRLLLSMLDVLLAKRMNVVLVAHSQVKTFKSPEAGIDDYDRYELKLNGKAAGLVKEWPDCVLFANYETLTADKNGKTKGVSTGKRLIHTERTAAYDAKNRYSLPSSLPLAWDAFASAVKAGADGTADKLVTEIRALLPRLPEKLRVEAEGGLGRAGRDLGKLTTLRDFLTPKAA